MVIKSVFFRFAAAVAVFALGTLVISRKSQRLFDFRKLEPQPNPGEPPRFPNYEKPGFGRSFAGEHEKRTRNGILESELLHSTVH